MKSLKLQIDKNLPIYKWKQSLMAAISTNSVVIVAGETGSGKSTQLPKLCLEMFQGDEGVIGHTQPRRLAARAVANRIAVEVGVSLGDVVGFKVRFSDQVSKSTRIKLMTDGILLAEIEQDRWLSKYKVLIIDEAHERSLNIDFLLGYLKQLLKKRDDLKVVITSATLDHHAFSDYFDHAPLIEVSGRSYPVTIQYLDDCADVFESSGEKDMHQAILIVLNKCFEHSSGDVLIFFATEREIRECKVFLDKALRIQYPHKSIEVLPLFGRLSAGEQQKVFQPSKKCRIILSTNVAETSVTVPNIHFVIDTGMVRMSRYSYKSKIGRLPVEPISQASANQRSGRCGRIAPGLCFRLYEKADFDARDLYTDPEILRTNLAAVILKMALLKLGHIDDFPFIQKPDPKVIKDGYRLLNEIGAMDVNHKMTPLGRLIARFPIEPRLGKMLCTAHKKNVLREVLVIVSFLSVPDVRERPLDKQQAADEAHRKFWYGASDFMTVLNLWDKSRFSSNKTLRQFCETHFVSFVRMREWADIHRQLIEITKKLNWTVGEYQPDEPYLKEAIHQSILSGLLSHIAEIDEKKVYRGARHVEWHLFPGSCIFQKPPKWIMAYEITHTHKTYAKMVAKIDPHWLEGLAKHLIKKQYFEPALIKPVDHQLQPNAFSSTLVESIQTMPEEKARLSALCKITLYGLAIIPSKKVNYGPINPKVCREILIREGIVMRAMESHCPFLLHNRALEDECRRLENKARRSDVLMDEHKLFAYYDKRLPQLVFDGPSFKKWYLSQSDECLASFNLTTEDMIQHHLDNESEFPDTLKYKTFEFNLSYEFDPNGDRDGVSVCVPQVLLKQISPHLFDWLVPGLLEEKVTQLIKSMPKSLRRQFVPAPAVAKSVIVALKGVSRSESLLDALANTLSNLGRSSVSVSDFDVKSLDKHLMMRIVVLDEQGQALDAFRDTAQAHDQLAIDLDVEQVAQDHPWQKTGVCSFEFESIPDEVKLNVHGVELQLYPAVKDCATHVDLILCDTPSEASMLTPDGIRRLFYLATQNEQSQLRLSCAHVDALMLAYKPIGSDRAAREDLFLATCAKVFDLSVRSKSDFDQALSGRDQYIAEASELARLSAHHLALFNEINKIIKHTKIPLNLMANYSDISSQLAHLCYEMFMSQMPLHYFRRLPHYLKGIKKRLERLEYHPAKDRDIMLNIAPEWGEYVNARFNPQDELRWAFEEKRLRDY